MSPLLPGGGGVHGEGPGTVARSAVALTRSGEAIAKNRSATPLLVGTGPAVSRGNGRKCVSPQAVLPHLLPVAVLAGLAVLDASGGARYQMLGLTVIAPLVAAALLGLAATAGYATAAVAVTAAFGLADAPSGSTYDSPALLVRTAGVAVGSCLAIWVCMDRRRRNRRLAAVQRVADVVQRAILDGVPPQLGRLRLAVSYVSASAEASVGGDLFAVVPTDFGVRMLVADVRGKGLPAVTLANRILGAMMERAPERAELSDVAVDLDRAVQRYTQSQPAFCEDFATAVLVQIDCFDVMTVINAGHPGPLLLRGGVVALGLVSK